MNKLSNEESQKTYNEMVRRTVLTRTLPRLTVTKLKRLSKKTKHR